MRCKPQKREWKPHLISVKNPPKKGKVQKWSSITRSKLFVYYALKIFIGFSLYFSDPFLAVFSKKTHFLPKKHVFRTFFKKLWCRFSLKLILQPCSSKMDFQKKTKNHDFLMLFPLFSYRNSDFGPPMGIVFPNLTVLVFLAVFFMFFYINFWRKRRFWLRGFPLCLRKNTLFEGFWAVLGGRFQ